MVQQCYRLRSLVDNPIVRLQCTIRVITSCFGVERPCALVAVLARDVHHPGPTSRSLRAQSFGDTRRFSTFFTVTRRCSLFPLPSACAAGTAMCARFRVCEIPEEGKVALLTTLRRLGLALALRDKRHFLKLVSRLPKN